MTRERWTLLLMRSKDCQIRQFSMSARTIHLSIGLVTFLLTSVSGLGLTIGLGGAARLEARKLAEQNELLTTTLENMRSRVQGLELSLDDLTLKDSQIRILAGLDPIEKDVLEVGVGGPGLSTPESNPLYALDETLGKNAFAVTYDLNALERRIRLLHESISETNLSMASEKDRLESTPSILPIGGGLLSSRFSSSRYHPIHNRALPHEGIDISAPRGTAILAAAKGKVVEAGTFAGYGLMVEIDHGHGFTTRYGHASRIQVRVGQTVERGDVVALVGSTGIATGPHLHYEVRLNGKPQNPMNYVLPEALP